MGTLSNRYNSYQLRMHIALRKLSTSEGNFVSNMPKFAKQTTGEVTRHKHKLGKLKAVKITTRRGKPAKKSTKAKKSAQAKEVKGSRVTKFQRGGSTIYKKLQGLRAKVKELHQGLVLV